MAKHTRFSVMGTTERPWLRSIRTLCHDVARLLVFGALLLVAPLPLCYAGTDVADAGAEKTAYKFGAFPRLAVGQIDKVANTSNIAIIRSTLDLGHNLGLQVIAEGVENSEACFMLKSMGCDMAQGYYFSRPVPAERIVEYIAKLTIENMHQTKPIAAG